MIYDTKYIDIKVGLIYSILIDLPENILDVSYSVDNKNINIQIIVLEGTAISKDFITKVENNLNEYKISFKSYECSKESFNENKGNWKPATYCWLDIVLYSKSEIL